MKKILLCLLANAVLFIAHAQNIGMGTNNPHASALLELNSTNKGLLLPRVADTSSVNNPAKGLVIFTNGNNKLWYYNGIRWEQAVTNATGSGGIWYELNDSSATTEKSFIGINTDIDNAQQANLQVTGSLLIHGSLSYSNKNPTNTYTMNTNGSPIFVSTTDSIFRVLDPGGSNNYSNNNLGNISMVFLTKQVGIKVSSMAADFGIGPGDTLWFSENGFPDCKKNFTHRITHTTTNPSEILLGSSTQFVTFQANADGANGKGFNLTITRLFQLETPKPLHPIGNALSFNHTNGSFAAGYNVNNITASGKTAIAMGFSIKASGDYSTAIGTSNLAEGEYATALGFSSRSMGKGAMAMGYGVIAIGDRSVAMGSFTEAGGWYSTAMGYSTGASGDYATSIGANTQASGDYATTMGLSTLSRGYAGTVVGMYNDPILGSSQQSVSSLTPLFIVGNGDNGLERSNALTVLKNGKVGIGTLLPPVSVLQLAGGSDASLATNSGFLVIGDANSTNLVMDNNEIMARNNGVSSTLYLQNDGGAFEIGGTAAKPGGGSWSASSDARLKQNIQPYKDGLTHLQKINPVYFNYNSQSGYDTTKQFIGVVAQELQTIAPYMVGTFKKKDTEYLNVDNTAMTYMLINAVKEQQQQIDELKALVNKLLSITAINK